MAGPFDEPPAPPSDGGSSSSGGGSSSGGSSSSGSSSSSGGSSAAPALEPYLEVLVKLQLPLTGIARKFAQHAAQAGWSASEFMFNLRKTKFYRQRFRGIFRGDGTMRVTESEYLALERAYRQIAGAVGKKLNHKQVAVLIKGDVDPEEFKLRYQILGSMKANPEAQDIFNELLTRQGMKKLDQKGWFRFLMGKHDKALYDLYEAFSLQGAAGGEFQRGEVNRIARALGTPGELTDLSAVTSTLEALREEAGQEIAAAGITAKDLVLATVSDALTGKEAARAKEVARTVEQIINNRRARKAAPEAQSGASLIGEGRPVVPSAPAGELESI